jgi:hypothetical protein
MVAPEGEGHFDNFGLAYLFIQFSLKYGCSYIFWGYISQKFGCYS